MRIVLGILMALHGIAHVPGFIGGWRLAELEGMPYGTTLLAGRPNVSDAGMRIIGSAWLLGALGFMLAAFGAMTGRPWWMPVAIGMALGSLVLSGLGWPTARIGVAVNLAILLALLAGRRYGWLGAGM